MVSLARRVRVVVLAAVVLAVVGVSPAQGQGASRSEREAVVFVAPLDSVGMSAVDKALYDSVELAAYGGAAAILSPVYNRVSTVSGSGATLASFINVLRNATNRAGIDAVDLIFVTHGATSEVFFSDGARTMTTVRNSIVNNLTAAQRGRLRMVFSTACFGETHRARWIEAGFDTASGATGIYADSAATYVPFLTSWALGQSFASSVSAANNVDFFRVFDNLAKGYYNSKNKPLLANQVNSFRLRSGNTGLTIDNNPVGTFRLAPARKSVVIGRRATYNFSWTVPKPRTWRRLRSMGLRLKVLARLGVKVRAPAIALRWDQASNRFQLVNGSDRRIGGSKRAGRRGSLKGAVATLNLRRTRVVGRGRTARLTLPLTFFKKSAAGRTFRVQVRADEDSGRKAPWQDAGTISVKR